MIQDNIPSIRFDFSLKEERFKQERVNAFIPNEQSKRWMMLDATKNFLHVAMDHNKGDIDEQELRELNIPYKIDGTRGLTRIYLHSDNAVELYVFDEKLVDFEDNKFLEFLHKHFSSYVKRVSTARIRN
ncbi:hypothetical protein ACTQ5K_08730 [Niallia sp. Sow4_A1]|uniref:hypothetical protein n=1 Tax=unclassified Niallia TaxID=2837522 RepID=UPI00203EF54D|nr:hypothetical protein [Niallia sp. MER TA 168]MCM3364222.1 hypothetical protein [Niallia sp. MER TA 168]